MADSPFFGPSYQLEGRIAGIQRLVNMCLVPLESGNDRAQYVLKDVQGLVLLQQTNAPPAPPPPPPPPPPPFPPYTVSFTLNGITNASPTTPQFGVLQGGLEAAGVYSVKQLDPTKAWRESEGTNAARSDFFIAANTSANSFLGATWCKPSGSITYNTSAEAVAAFPTNITITGSTTYLFAISDDPVIDNSGSIVITLERIA